MAAATSQDPPISEPADNAPLKSRDFVSLARRGLAFLWGQRNWLFVLIPFAFACWLPMQYSYRNWGEAGAPLAFQPLVPIGAALLAWQQRERLKTIWRRQQVAEASSSKRKTGKDNMLLLIAGILVLLFGHLVHVDSFFALGLLLLVAGIILYFYGSAILKTLAVPLLLLVLMVNLPDSVLSHSVDAAKHATTVAASAVLVLFGVHATASERLITLGDHALEVTTALSGLNLVLVMVFLAFWYNLFTRRSIIFGAFWIVFSAGITILFHVLRLAVLARTNVSSPEFEQFLAGINLWFLVATLSVILLYIAQAFQLLMLRFAVLEQQRSRQKAGSTLTGKVDKALDPVFRASGKGVEHIASRQRVVSKGIDRIFVKLGTQLSAQQRKLSKNIDGLFTKKKRRSSGKRRGGRW